MKIVAKTPNRIFDVQKSNLHKVSFILDGVFYIGGLYINLHQYKLLFHVPNSYKYPLDTVIISFSSRRIFRIPSLSI